MTRLTTIAVALLLAGGVVFAQARAQQTTGQTTPPQTAPPKPPETQTPAPKPALPTAPVQLPFPPGATIAYVQMQGVISGSKFGKCGSAVLNDMRTKDKAVLAPKQKEITDLQQKVQSQQGLVNEATLTQMQRDLQRLQTEYQALGQQLQTDEENKNQDLLSDFQTKILPLLEQLRKDKELNFILSADQNGAIVAANTALDLTSELVKRLDAAYPDCTKKTGSN